MVDQNFVEMLEGSIRFNWDSQALSDYKGAGFKYSEVAVKIRKIHLAFNECGIKRGDKISLAGKNSVNWAVAYLSIITYGAVVVPILPDFMPGDIQNIVEHSDSILLFSSESINENLDRSKMPALLAIYSLADFTLMWSRDEKLAITVSAIPQLFEQKYQQGFSREMLIFPKISNSELAVLNYTSGTTGFSKGVMITFNSLAANVVYAHNNMPLKPGDSIVSFLPLAHTYGCAFEFLFPFTLGCHITFLTKTPSPQIIIEAFQAIKPRLVLCVPLIIEKIYKKQILPIIQKQPIKTLLSIPLLNQIIFRKIKQKLVSVFGGNFYEVVIGGAALNRDVEILLKKTKFPFSTGYGMTECGPLISYASWQNRKKYSAGKLIDYLEVQIDSTDPYNEVGDILVKGDNVMIGYYKNEKATKDVLTNDGWLNTGDLGIIDKEKNIYIRGRSKNLILGASGQNIYPEEIEAKLNNMELVQDSIVIERDKKIVALVVPEFDVMQKKGIEISHLDPIMEEYRKEINKQIPTYMQISVIQIYHEEFAKTPKKSIKRYLYA